MALTNITNSGGLGDSPILPENGHVKPSPDNRDRLRQIASSAKAKTQSILLPLSHDDEVSSFSENDDLFADAAFSPSQPAGHDSDPDSDSDSNNALSKGVNSAKEMLLHPRRTIRQKATKTTAAQISSASKPPFSSNQQRDLVDAYDRLTTAKTNAASSYATDSTSESTDTDVENAGKQVEQYEDQRKSTQTAWLLDRHVDRVRVVQWSIPKPRREEYPATDGSALHQGKIDWPRYLARLLLYHSYSFTAPYVDDLESPPFDIDDLTLLLERFLAISNPWQTFFLSCRQVYTWESPPRTLKWAVLFWTLWYTDHIIGYVYVWVIYITIRNRYYPSSVQSIRESLGRGTDRAKQARSWSELISHHGQDAWLEPLLDDLGPIIQLQLRDTTDFLEVLNNFYGWERPKNTAAALFVFFMLLLITLLCDMDTCIRFLWMFIGGGFFFTFPIATNYPRYRKIVNLVGWFWWNMPNHAELAITRLQEKARENDAKSMEIKHEIPDINAAGPRLSHEQKQRYDFRAYAGKARGVLSISRTGLQWVPRPSSSSLPSVTILFSHLQEMHKLRPSPQLKSTKFLQSSKEGLLFIYTAGPTAPAPNPTPSSDMPSVEKLALHVKSRTRHEIFTLVLAWSGQRWQALPLERHRYRAEQTKTFDKALKRALP